MIKATIVAGDNKSGIYCIENTINNNIYIGSSYNIYKRKLTHLCELRKGTHHCYYLQRSFNKYGEDNFIFYTIEECSNDKLIEREQYYIDKLIPKYNICRIAGSSLGTKRTKETRRKLSESHKGQKAWNKGIPRTSEEIENQRNKIIGKPSKRKGTTISKESRLKMSLAQKGKVLSKEHKQNLSKRIKEYDLEGNYITTHNSLTEAAKSINSIHTNLCRAMKNNKKFKNKIFKYE